MAIIALLGGDLSAPYQFIRVCEAMAELGRDEDVLAWARRGIAETRGWQVATLYDLVCAVHERSADRLAILALRREQHERMASAGTYRALRLARRTRLAEARERTRPDEALAWYLQVVDEHLLQTGRPAYARAVSTLKRARRAAQADAFATALTDLRERHRRRPALIAMLDNAALG